MSSDVAAPAGFEPPPELEELRAEVRSLCARYPDEYWRDLQPDGSYVRRIPAVGEPARDAQQMLLDRLSRRGLRAVPAVSSHPTGSQGSDVPPSGTSSRGA